MVNIYYAKTGAMTCCTNTKTIKTTLIDNDNDVKSNNQLHQ